MVAGRGIAPCTLVSLTANTVGAATAWAIIAYLAGSIPFGLILTKVTGHGDIRALGSGNIGATNVLRTGDKWLALVTLICDVLKGLLPVAIAARFSEEFASIAALATVLGHVFPVWLKFKGGKGVATGVGVLIAYAWPAAAAAIAPWLAVALVFRYSSLAALAATALAPFYTWLFVRDLGSTFVVLAIAIVIIARHATNIARLLRGEESRISLGKEPA